MNSSPTPLMPFRLGRGFHLAGILGLFMHGLPFAYRGPAAHLGGINRGHAEAPPRAKRRKWKGWQQQLREQGRR